MDKTKRIPNPDSDPPRRDQELTPEDVARALIDLPADHQWEYLKKEKSKK